MSVFDTHAAAVVQTTAATYADDAVYTPLAGPPSVEIRIVLGWKDQAVGFSGFDTEVRSPGLRGEVAQPLLPTPEKGAAMEVLTGKHVGTYTVWDFFSDPVRAKWMLDLS